MEKQLKCKKCKKAWGFKRVNGDIILYPYRKPYCQCSITAPVDEAYAYDPSIIQAEGLAHELENEGGE